MPLLGGFDLRPLSLYALATPRYSLLSLSTILREFQATFYTLRRGTEMFRESLREETQGGTQPACIVTSLCEG